MEVQRAVDPDGRRRRDDVQVAVSTGTPLSEVRALPMTSKPPNASPAGSIDLWQALHEASAVSFSSAVRSESPGVAEGSGGVLAGGAGMSWQKYFSTRNAPRLAGFVRSPA